MVFSRLTFIKGKLRTRLLIDLALYIKSLGLMKPPSLLQKSKCGIYRRSTMEHKHLKAIYIPYNRNLEHHNPFSLPVFLFQLLLIYCHSLMNMNFNVEVLKPHLIILFHGHLFIGTTSDKDVEL